MKLINPANRRKHSLIVVGSGLAGAAAAATLGQQGYRVQCFSYHDTPRRAHSIAAQGGINAAKNYRNEGDSIDRLFKAYTAAWEWKGSDQGPALHKEPLAFEYVPLSQRSYK